LGYNVSVMMGISPKIRGALAGLGLLLMGAGWDGYVISIVQGHQNGRPAAVSPGSPTAPSALECDPPVYYGIQHCTQGAIHILRIDPKAPRVRFETVLPQGYDREGNFGECRDVLIPQYSTGPGCQVDGEYPRELVGDMAERYPGAVVAFNADFFGHIQGPQGLTVKNGVRLDGLYGDHDENEVTRGSLSVSSDGDVRIGIVDRDGLPNPAQPWTWVPDPLIYYNSVGGVPMLVRDGVPVNIKKQCTLELPPYGGLGGPPYAHCYTRHRVLRRFRRGLTKCLASSVGRFRCPAPNKERARTAVGRTEDGQLIVVVVPESAGLTLWQLRNTLVWLGAVEALNLDGGGSSQLWYDGDYLVPSDRPVAGGLLVLSQVGRPPSAPGSLSATPTGLTGVHLSWTDNADDEEGFKVFRDGSQIATVGAGITSYEDRGLTPGATYVYTVTAWNSFGDSEASDTAIAAGD